MPTFLNNLIHSKKAVTFIGIGLALVIAVVWVFTAFNSTQKQMVAKEQALSAQYSANQNELGSFVSSIRESLGVADRGTDKLNEVLADAVKGRYEGDTSAQPGGGQMFSAIVEAYPDLNGVNVSYAKVQDAVIAGRAAYKNKQDKLLDMLRAYETWKNSGFIKSKMTSMVGAPSDNLKASIGTNVKRGSDALDAMYLIVLPSEAREAYTSGEHEPMDLNPAPAATEPAP